MPRDGARVVRGPRGGGGDERALRAGQGRPRGAPGRRRHLHGRRAGHDRPRRLAAERLPHARRRAVLRRHLLPARAAPGHAELADGAGGRRPARGTSSATTSSTARERIVGRLQATAQLQAPDAELDPASLDAAVAALKRGYDAEHGGWGGAPKFPAASAIEFLLRRGERQMALHTLRRMAGGGIYDQVGGGFARYSVDARWVVPHFEKMLYDNALLARAYLHAFQVSGEPFFERVHARDARLGAARAAPGGGRLRQRARRRLRGRRGQVLRLDSSTRCARRSARAGRRRDRALRHDRGRQLRGRQHPGARDVRPGAARRDQGRLLEARSSSACGRGSTTSA